MFEKISSIQKRNTSLFVPKDFFKPKKTNFYDCLYWLQTGRKQSKTTQGWQVIIIVDNYWWLLLNSSDDLVNNYWWHWKGGQGSERRKQWWSLSWVKKFFSSVSSSMTRTSHWKERWYAIHDHDDRWQEELRHQWQEPVIGKKGDIFRCNFTKQYN